jgi:FkbM family methyltransferase
VVLDIGANVGFFTLLASTLAGREGHVFALEPVPRNITYLRRHLDLNNASNTTVIEAAAADTCGTGFISNTSDPSMGSLGSTGISVPLVTLDALLAEGTIAAPSVMKIDVEGAESRVLAGAKSLLQIARPQIFLSTHGWQQHQICWEYLEALSYEVRLRRDGRADGQYEVVALPKRSGSS